MLIMKNDRSNVQNRVYLSDRGGTLADRVCIFYRYTLTLA